MEQEAWLAAAEPQLLPLVPKQLWVRLHEKLAAGVFDAGTVLGFAELEEPAAEPQEPEPQPELAAQEASESRQQRLDRLSHDEDVTGSTPASAKMQLVAARAMAPAEDIFLCDHAWSFGGPDMARAQLAEHPQLRARIGAMLLGRCGEGLSGTAAVDDRAEQQQQQQQQQQQHDDVDWLMRGLWGLSGSYSIDSDADAMVVHYVLDEIGSSFAPTPSPDHLDPDTAAFLMVPFINPQDGVAYSIFFPRRRVCEWERATCAGLPHATGRASALTRVLLPQPDLTPQTISRAIWSFRDTLGAAGFDCKTVCDLLRVEQLTPSSSDTLSGDSFAYTYLPAWDLGPGSAANANALAWLDKLEAEQAQPPLKLLDLVRLFVLGKSIESIDRVAAAVGGMDVLRAIAALGILWQPAGAPCSLGDSDDRNAVSAWASCVQLVPVPLGTTTDAKCFYAATDWPNASATLRFGGEQEEPVMYVGPDTLGLVSAMVAVDGPLTSFPPTMPDDSTKQRTPIEVLDLCCGCGVQSLAIAMCRQARSIGGTSLTLIDRSPRAVRFARFNALLNGIAEDDARASTQVAVYCGDACDVASVLPQRSHANTFDAVLINPPYIPNPEQTAGLETFGDGGWSGEELTAAAVSQSRFLLRPRAGILAVVANLPNADEYPAKLQRWWEIGAALEHSRDENAGGTRPRSLEATVLCGCKWSTQRYAELIHMYDSSSVKATTTDNYARALERSGVNDVCNGFVFARTTASADGQIRCAVSTTHDQIWQAVAGVFGPSEALRIQTAASDACRN